MAKLEFPTDVDLPGPWLIDVSALRELQTVVDQQWERLTARREQALREKIDEVFDRLTRGRTNLRESDLEAIRHNAADLAKSDFTLRDHARTIVFSLRGAKTFTADSFTEAISAPQLAGERITRMTLTIRSADLYAELDMSKGFAITQCRVLARGGDDAARADVFSRLEEWADNHGPPRWTRYAYWWPGALYGAGWSLMMLFFIALPIGPPANTYTRQAAQDLLARGIDSQDKQRQAIELLLSLQSGYNRKVPEHAGEPTTLVICWYLVGVIVLLLCVRPGLVIGIGQKGKAALRFWKKWITVLGVTIPTLVFGTFIWPWIAGHMRGWLGL